MKLYRGEHLFGKHKGPFVWTGEFRSPLRGEYFLSGSVPTAYYTFNNLSMAYHIMRPATDAEIFCPCCQQRKRMEA